MALTQDQIRLLETRFGDKPVSSTMALLTPEQITEARKTLGIPPDSLSSTRRPLSEILGTSSHLELSPSQAQIETWKSQYHVTPVYNREEWLQNLEFIALCILLAFVIFFLIKGAFYYIVLGKINPPKE